MVIQCQDVKTLHQHFASCPPTRGFPPPKKQQVSTESVKRAKTTCGEAVRTANTGSPFNLVAFNDEKLRFYVALGNSASFLSTLLSCDRDPNKVSMFIQDQKSKGL